MAMNSSIWSWQLQTSSQKPFDLLKESVPIQLLIGQHAIGKRFILTRDYRALLSRTETRSFLANFGRGSLKKPKLKFLHLRRTIHKQMVKVKGQIKQSRLHYDTMYRNDKQIGLMLSILYKQLSLFLHMLRRPKHRLSCYTVLIQNMLSSLRLFCMSPLSGYLWCFKLLNSFDRTLTPCENTLVYSWTTHWPRTSNGRRGLRSSGCESII